MTIKNYSMILLLLSAFSYAQAQDTNNNSLVWEISKDGVENSSYIVLTTSGICDIPAKVLNKASGLSREIKVYYTENALGNKKYDNLSEGFLMLKKGEPSIQKLLSADDYLKLKNRMSEQNMDEKVLNRLKPLLIYNLLMKKVSPECNTPSVVQQIFRTYADEHGIPTKELLDINETFGYLNSFGTDFYIAEIIELLNNQPKISEEIKEKADLYEIENLESLKQLFAKSSFLSSKNKNATIAQNHIKKISKLISEIKDGGALFSLELTNAMDNKNNIFDELKSKGFTITIVN